MLIHTGLTHYYAFENSYVDSAASEFAATAVPTNNPTFTPAVCGNVCPPPLPDHPIISVFIYLFQGLVITSTTNSSVLFPETEFMNYNGDFTISFWVKVGVIANGTAVILSKR